MSERTTQWYIDCIKKAENPNGVLKVWREAEEHLGVIALVKVHEACRSKIIKSIKEVKND